MTTTMRDIMNPCLSTGSQPDFPNAPEDWTEKHAYAQAKVEELELGPDHWELIKALQSYFSRNAQINARELSDAINEKFHAKGGMKYLYGIFPGGPITQGCRLAGLQTPSGANNCILI